MRGSYPLNALRAFEASARHLSFVLAGQELNVTPAAVSQQVKKLEEFLSVKLFWRQTRGLLLTAEGQKLWPELRDVFLRLDSVINHMSSRREDHILSISVAPVFASKWLLPRLQDFATDHPEIDLRISANLDLVDFEREDYDAALRFGKGDFPGLQSDLLFEESVTAMCSPRLLEGDMPLRHPEDLRHHILLHDDSTSYDPKIPTWKTWLAAANVESSGVERGPHFGQPDHALQAAIDGVGVALGWRKLAEDDLCAGRLVAPFDLTLPLGRAFYFVCQKPFADRKKTRIFRNWMFRKLAEA
jgi:LysR family glycine cleavage system transcriptional activator